MNAMVTTATGTRPLAASVLALVGFDLRRFRVLAVLMVAFELGRAAFVEWSLRFQPVIVGDRFGTFGTEEVMILDLLLGIATAVGTALIVQADPPSDDRAFWRTRPIAPTVLALGKLATLALLFVVLPSAVDAARLLAYGAPLVAVAAGTLQIGVLAGSVVVPAWALALTARTLPRFLAAVVGLLVIGVLTIASVNYWSSVWGAGLPVSLSGLRTITGDWQGRYSHGWWNASAVTAGGLAILAAHYWHRRRSASIAAAVALLTVRLFIPAVGPSTDASPELARLVSGRVGIGALQLPGDPLVDARRRSSAPFPIPLEIQFTLPELPPDVWARLTAQDIRLVGRETVHVGDGWQCCFGPGPMVAVSSTLSRKAAADRPARGFAIDAAALATLGDGTASLRGDAELRFERHRLAADIPLRPGAAVQVGGQQIEVLATNAQRAALLVRYASFPSLAPSGNTLSLFVGDAARTQVATSVPGWTGPTRPVTALAWHLHRAVARSWAGRYPVFVDLGPAIQPGARLYVVESIDAGRVRMPLAIDGIPIRFSGGDPSTRPR